MLEKTEYLEQQRYQIKYDFIIGEKKTKKSKMHPLDREEKMHFIIYTYLNLKYKLIIQ